MRPPGFRKRCGGGGGGGGGGAGVGDAAARVGRECGAPRAESRAAQPHLPRNHKRLEHALVHEHEAHGLGDDDVDALAVGQRQHDLLDLGAQHRDAVRQPVVREPGGAK
jgi:hypothetical protein